jgi:hypothetical protein
VVSVLFLVPSKSVFEPGGALPAAAPLAAAPLAAALLAVALLAVAIFAGIGLVGAGLVLGPAAADSQRNYLDLSHDTMRQQLAADNLEAAARTLAWIRRVDADDDVATVLAAELQLRRGNVALAAMALLDIISDTDTGQAAVLEAHRVLTGFGDSSHRQGVIVTGAMLEDAASRRKTPVQGLLAAQESGAFSYAVVMTPQPVPDMTGCLLVFAPTTPAIEMAKVAGRVPPVRWPLPGALDSESQRSGLLTAGDVGPCRGRSR